MVCSIGYSYFACRDVVDFNAVSPRFQTAGIESDRGGAAWCQADALAINGLTIHIKHYPGVAAGAAGVGHLRTDL